MKRILTLLIFLTILLSINLSALTADTSVEDRVDSGDVMHPIIVLQDKEGNPITREGTTVSSERTCGKCHDWNYINNHNTHYTSSGKADCIECHFKDGRMEGDYTLAHLRIQAPTDQNCALCHGIVQVCAEPLVIPPGYGKLFTKDENGNHKYYGITLRTGVILSPQNLNASYLNLKDKEQLDYPWDVHSRRQLDCVSCHYISNDPRYCGKIDTPLDHLKRDPRKVQSTAEILKRPNHKLKFADCTCCHDPMVVHKDFPYKKRHMEALSCNSCHVPEIFGPALQAVDNTVITEDGEPKRQYRGLDEKLSHGDNLSTAYFYGYKPFLLPHKATNKMDRISPFNLISHWKWISAKTGKSVSKKQLKNVFLEGSGYAADISKAFDKNKNGRVENGELQLDTPEKIKLVKEKLRAQGIEEPVISGSLQAYKVNHGVVNYKRMERDCNRCHSSNATFGQEILLSANAPGGIIPEYKPTDNDSPILNGNIEVKDDGTVVLTRTTNVDSHYVFGHGRISQLDYLGLWIFILSVLGVAGHGLLRLRAARKMKHTPARTQKVYMYRFYERLWHWTMATAIIILALTGLEIHNTGAFRLFGLETAVRVHNILAGIMVLNALLSLFYHITTGEIKQFFRFNRKFIKETLVQLYYYLHGIFKGTPHPVEKSVERKLNPLQQVTYVGLLNILLPFQVITGALIWGVGKWPFLSEQVNGLTVLGPIHNFGSWFFLAFLVVHIYLTTTGHSVFSNIKAMITGYDEIPEGKTAHHDDLMNMKVMDLMGTLIKNMKASTHPVDEEQNADSLNSSNNGGSHESNKS
jgi:thiosulfate reductase cytochrome b subunit/mono/diheme cytochrome c family protein